MQKRAIFVSLLLLLLPACTVQQTQSGATIPTQSPSAPSSSVSSSNGHALQLGDFALSTPTPTVQPSAPPAVGIGEPLVPGIGNGSCIEDGQSSEGHPCCPGVGPGAMLLPGGQVITQGWCDAKPVIYLYPQIPTQVAVSITVPGSITESIPTYPAGGWQHILANPDGSFWYNNTRYTELFYESSIKKTTPPANGYVVATDKLAQTLVSLTSQFGLQSNEQKEFLLYWLPKLQALHAPYIFVSYFSPQAKDAIDHVTITPQPDVFLAYIFYFKPLQSVVPASAPMLPAIPQRHGFTAVEWGAVVDQ